ncbi:tetratricopeptide repeat protein [Flavobacterium akiainvivens]|nr:tetratricopeptide repeat protein [Flavobacterium akiainvivens]
MFIQAAFAQQNGWLKYEYATAEQTQKALSEQKSQNAFALNLKGIYLEQTGKPEEAVAAYSNALDKAEGNTTIAILLNRALSYNRTGNLGGALDDCNKALKLNTAKNPLYEATAWRIMGNAYLYKDDTEKAISLLQKAISGYEKYNNVLFAAETKGELANVYLMSNNYEVAAELYKNYLDKAENKQSRPYISTLLNYTECLIELNKGEEARELLLKHLPDAEASADREIAGAFYSRLGNVEKSTGNKAAALGYYEKACNIFFEMQSKHLILILSDYIKLINNPADYGKAVILCQKFKQSPMYKRSFTQARFEYERAAAELFKKAGLQNEAYAALATSLELCDSLRQVNNGQDMYGALAKYRTQVEEEKNKSLKKEMDDDKKINALIWILVAFFAVGKVFLFRSIWLKNKLSKQKLKTIEAQAALLTEQEELVRQKAESQKTMIEEKEREMISISLKMAKYNDSLQNIVAQVDQKKITSLTECKNEINKVIAEDGFWDYFDLRFTQLHPDFKVRLSDQYPSLSKSEVDFCSLLRLNLSNKEIGSLLYISYESVISKRYRIRKKMELNEEDDLNAVLENLG